MRVGIFLFCFLFLLDQIKADTLKVAAKYSVPVNTLQFNETENPTYTTSVEMEDTVCELSSPRFIRYLLPTSLAGESLPILLKKTNSEDSYLYYTGKNVSEAKCSFTMSENKRSGTCFILYDNLDVDLNLTIKIAQKEFSTEGTESLAKRLKASRVFASSEPAGFLHFQYNCPSAP